VVKSTENIADILSRWESESSSSKEETKYQTIRKNVAPVQAIGGGDSKLYLKRRLFRTPQKIPTDPVEYHLIYSQAVHSVLRGDFPLNDQAALRLAGLKAQVDWGDYDPAQTGRLSTLTNFLPAKFIAEKPKDEWIKEIAAIHSKLVGKSALQAKVLYLEAVKQFPMYGATFFNAVYKGFWQHSNNVTIAVHVDGIAWLHQKTKAILKFYSYERLDSWELEEKLVVFNLKAEPGEPDTETHRVEFQCDEAEEVVNLVKEYSPAHRVSGKDDKKKAAAAAATAAATAKAAAEPEAPPADMGQMAVNLDTARQRLLASGQLRSPGPESLSSGGKFGTLRKLTVKKVPVPEQTKGPAQYTVADWCFSKNKLSFSLSNFNMETEAELNETALKIQNSIMAYGGYTAGPQSTDPDDSRVPMCSLVQDLMRVVIDNARLRDEMYLQLIKQTTNHPEPDSKSVIKIWKLLCVACWICLPSANVLAYLQAHLHLAGYGTAPMFANRVREADHARYALRAVQRVMNAGNRRQPPSAEELAQVTNLKDMFTRFYYMDSQSRALTFDPATTSAEIIDVLKEKIGAKNCQGFALYESFGALERAMTGKEKIADTIYKWQKFAKQTNADKQLRIVFKRRIFMPPHNVFVNDMERDLVISQVMNDIAVDKYPVTDEEVVLLTALRTQIEVGDQQTYNGTESIYSTNSKKFIPKHMLKQGVEKAIALQHSKLKGKTKDECAKQIVEVLTSWEFYGHAIFNVLVRAAGRARVAEVGLERRANAKGRPRCGLYRRARFSPLSNRTRRRCPTTSGCWWATPVCTCSTGGPRCARVRDHRRGGPVAPPGSPRCAMPPPGLDYSGLPPPDGAPVVPVQEHRQLQPVAEEHHDHDRVAHARHQVRVQHERGLADRPPHQGVHRGHPGRPQARGQAGQGQGRRRRRWATAANGRKTGRHEVNALPVRVPRARAGSPPVLAQSWSLRDGRLYFLDQHVF